MDKYIRQKGKVKKGFSKLLVKGFTKLTDRNKKLKISASVQAKQKAKAVTVPISQHIYVYHRMLKFLQSNNKTIKIKHRDQEKKVLLDFVKENFDVEKLPVNIKTHPSAMIVFGQPGLGKTLVFHDILEELHTSRVCELLKPKMFSDSSKTVLVYYFNSMSYDYPRDLLICILKEMFKDDVKVNTEEDPEYYLQVFRKKIKEVLLKNFIIVMIDELDHLYYKCPTLFYSLIEFFNISLPGFVKIGIANTLNFFSHVSGTFMLLNIKFMIFKPYSVDQLKNILIDRIEISSRGRNIRSTDFISPSGIELLVKKIVSNNSSDVRFLLFCISEIIINKIETLKQASIANQTSPNIQQITTLEILDFVKNKREKKYVELVKNLSFQQQLILLAVCGLIKQEVLFINKSDVKKFYKKMLKSFDMDDKIEFDMLLDNLVGYSFIKIFKDSTKTVIKSELSKRELIACISEISLFQKELEKMI